MTVFNYCPDVVHTLFLGTFLIFIGSLLCDLRDVAPGANHAAKIAHIWDNVHKIYCDLDVTHSERIRSLKATDFRIDGDPYPMLKCKAAMCRHFMRVLEIALERYPNHDGMDPHRLRFITNANKFVDIVDQDVYHLSKDDGNAALSSTMACLTSYTVLSRNAIERGRTRYHMTFKFHWWWHLAKTCQRYNPRLGWVFSDEDWVGKIATIAHGASFARGDLRLVWPSVNKYLFGMELDIVFRKRFSM